MSIHVCSARSSKLGRTGTRWTGRPGVAVSERTREDAAEPPLAWPFIPGEKPRCSGVYSPPPENTVVPPKLIALAKSHARRSGRGRGWYAASSRVRSDTATLPLTVVDSGGIRSREPNSRTVSQIEEVALPVCVRPATMQQRREP